MKCKIIAEIGWNHMGDMDLAEKMIKEAANAGADYAKFQTWSEKKLKPGPWDTDGRRELYKKSELTQIQFEKLVGTCRNNNIKFLTSCFNKEDLKHIAKLSTSVKIPGQEVTNKELIKTLAGMMKKGSFNNVFVSTGASTYEEAEWTYRTLEEGNDGSKNIYMMHCVSIYPCPIDKVNLGKIPMLGDMYYKSKLYGHSNNELRHPKLGYSGHYPGIEDALASLDYNVQVIEKHFTIDNELPGRDNKFAILPDQLKLLCNYINNRGVMKTLRTSDYFIEEQEIRDVYRDRWSN